MPAEIKHPQKEIRAAKKIIKQCKTGLRFWGIDKKLIGYLINQKNPEPGIYTQDLIHITLLRQARKILRETS